MAAEHLEFTFAHEPRSLGQRIAHVLGRVLGALITAWCVFGALDMMFVLRHRELVAIACVVIAFAGLFADLVLRVRPLRRFFDGLAGHR